MIKLGINYAKSHLPQSMIKGTTEHRLQAARLMNLKFFDNLQDSFNNREVKPGTFKRVLKSTIGHKPIKVDIMDSSNPKSGRASHILNEKGIAEGYCIEIPHTFYYKTISLSTARIFLQETQNFLEELFNPKFFKRFVTLQNKGYNTRELGDFYLKNIHETQKLTPKALEKFLKGKPATEQIDTLQHFRYQLQKEQNRCKGLKGIEKSIEKHTTLQQIHEKDFFEFKEFAFDQKFEILENKLKQLIQAERGKNKNSVL